MADLDNAAIAARLEAFAGLLELGAPATTRPGPTAARRI